MPDRTENEAVLDEGWIRTYTGKRFRFDDPRPEDVDVRDIAHALAFQCRYNGHCPEFYSVAQHSVVVMRLHERLFPDGHRAALFHDAAEAYVGDMVSPLKRRLPAVREVEWSVARAVEQALVLPPGFDDLPSVKHCDMLALAIECNMLFGIDPAEWGFDAAWPWREHADMVSVLWGPGEAEVRFLGATLARFLGTPLHAAEGAG